MRLALTDLYRARWTNQIHEEWIRSVLAIRAGLTRKQLERTRDLMNARARDALVTSFEDLILRSHCLIRMIATSLLLRYAAASMS